MKKASIQLKHYHYNKFHLEALNIEEQGADDVQQAPYQELNSEKLKTIIVFGEPEVIEDGAEHFFILTLGLEYKQPDFPYYFMIEVEGVFTILESEQDRMQRHLLVVNSASILYSSIRDQLLSLSSRHKYGPIMLPSLDFRSIKEAGE